jgi:glycosyltransferase involved in cell wall biosynthesis
MPSLSIVVIALDEERDLPSLLESARGVADEILLVDAGSADRTVELARAAGARVLHHDWVDFGVQRLFAVAQASHDFILSLDADERLSPRLAAAIRAEMARPEAELAAGYRIHFRHRVFGRPVRFGAMWRDRRIRLFDRRRGNFDGAPVHERVVVRGPVRLLPGRCDHAGVRSPAELAAKLDRYARAKAQERFLQGARFRPWHWLRWPAGFMKRYLLRLGFLDGGAGLRLAALYARYDLDKVRILRELAREGPGPAGAERATAGAAPPAPGLAPPPEPDRKADPAPGRS